MAYVNAEGCLAADSEQINCAKACSTGNESKLARVSIVQPPLTKNCFYELAVSPNSGHPLYLVSDGQFVVSPPHEHNARAVIAGIRGTEINRLYKAQSMFPRLHVSWK